MDRILGDTNILLRYSREDDPQHEAVMNALAKLSLRGDRVVVASQSLAEFWAVATRPTGSTNGLGYSPAQAEKAVGKLLAVFDRLPERDGAFDTWLDLVTRYGVSGKTTHDARLVATMLANGVGRILTFNGAHFARFAEVTVDVP